MLWICAPKLLCTKFIIKYIALRLAIWRRVAIVHWAWEPRRIFSIGLLPVYQLDPALYLSFECRQWSKKCLSSTRIRPLSTANGIGNRTGSGLLVLTNYNSHTIRTTIVRRCFKNNEFVYALCFSSTQLPRSIVDSTVAILMCIWLL